MRLRIKDPASGRQTTLTVDENLLTWPQLIDQIRRNLSMTADPALISLKQAAPPFHPIPTPVDSLPLEASGLRNGDSLLVSIHSNGSGSAPTGTAPSKSHSESRMIKRQVPDDNSCLFHSIAYLLLGDKRHTEQRRLRQMIVEYVRSNPSEYSAAVLGQPPDAYCQFIMQDKSWGGAIELSIFARKFHTQICAIDIETCQSYIFGEDQGYQNRVYLLYSGVHYDACVRQLYPGAQQQFDVCQVPSNDDLAFTQTLAVADEERRNHRFTNTSKFTLQCSVCGQAVLGQSEAQQHAHDTGHAEFQEYRASTTR